jgi:hypothetical protein
VHLFIEKHDIQVGPGRTEYGYFTPHELVAELWRKADEASTKINSARSALWSCTSMWKPG